MEYRELISTIIDNTRIIGGLTKEVDNLKVEVCSINGDIAEIKNIANDNRIEIKEIGRIINNGLSKELTRVKEALDDFKNNEMERLKKNISIYKDRETDRRTLHKDYQRLPEDSFFLRWLGMGVKKGLSIFIGIIIASALLGGLFTVGGWAALKSLVWHESPGLVQGIAAMHISGGANYHPHPSPFGKDELVLHANDPMLPAWRYNIKTGVMIPFPQGRTDGSLEDIKKQLESIIPPQMPSGDPIKGQ